MSDDTGMHRHDEPSAAELDRVRALLAGLGEEPAPAAVVARLERVLAAEPPPGPVAARRRGRWLRRGALGLAPVVAVAAVAAVLVIRNGDDTAGRRASAPPAPSAASAAEAAPSAGAAAASSAAADSAAGSALAPTAAADPPRSRPTRRPRLPRRRRRRPRPSARTPRRRRLPSVRRRSPRIVRRGRPSSPAVHRDRTRSPLPPLLGSDALRLGAVRVVRRPAARRRRRHRTPASPRWPGRGAASPPSCSTWRCSRCRRPSCSGSCPTGSRTPRRPPATRTSSGS